VNRGVVEGEDSSVSPRTLGSTKLCELLNCRDVGATFQHAAFPVALSRCFSESQWTISSDNIFHMCNQSFSSRI
jgi:hypothetical protein